MDPERWGASEGERETREGEQFCQIAIPDGSPDSVGGIRKPTIKHMGIKIIVSCVGGHDGSQMGENQRTPARLPGRWLCILPASAAPSSVSVLKERRGVWRCSLSPSTPPNSPWHSISTSLPLSLSGSLSFSLLFSFSLSLTCLPLPLFEYCLS